jgi:peptidoglycan/LPS O-acetylase OafA/YrhL
MYIEFLDGHRGALAYWVFIHHVYTVASLDSDYKYFFMTGYYIGVIGFFLLSSYLLTYRLLEEVYTNGTNLIQILLIVVKYFIRRFFRIYVPYVFIVLMIKYVSFSIAGHGNLNVLSLFQLLTLHDNILCHLWTIPPEIKYYFFIPVFVLISKLFNKNLIVRLLWIIFLIITLSFVERFNLFGIKIPETGIYPAANYSSLLRRFTTFFLGSLLALIMHLLENLDIYKKIENLKYSRLVFGATSMILYVAGMFLFSPVYNQSLGDRYFFRISVYWTLFLLTFIMGGSNF